MIRHAPGGDLYEPRAGVVRHSFLWPLRGGDEERFLHRVFRSGEIAVTAYDRAEHLRRQLAQQVLARSLGERRDHGSTGGPLITSRTSIGMFSGLPPGPGATDALAAIA